MHAFLIVGTNEKSLEKKAQEIATKTGSRLIDFELKKIEDVRTLSNTTKFKLSEPRTYLIKNIEEASEEALNAFLKNLEEPPTGLTYILSTKTLNNVLPTIVSRCEVIKIRNSELGIINSDIKSFLKMGKGEQLAFVDKIKERDKAVEFVEAFIESSHNDLYLKGVDYVKIAQNLKTGETVLKRLRTNGNTSLQLVYLVTNSANDTYE